MAYVLELGDEVLREQSLRQRRFLNLYDRMAAAGLPLEPLADPGGFSSLTPPPGKGPRHRTDRNLTPAASFADATKVPRSVQCSWRTESADPASGNPPRLRRALEILTEQSGGMHVQELWARVVADMPLEEHEAVSTKTGRRTKGENNWRW